MTGPSQSSLEALQVLIVDCQTTGASPALGSVLELGFGLASASDPELESTAEAHWIVPPEGERISAQVRQLTGFHESVLETAISPEQAWQRLRVMTGDAASAPTAIHYARFELSFLRDWAQRFAPTSEFPFEAVCVHAIACRLYPNLPRRNLRALAGFLGHGLHLERRSLGHVQATAFIWRKLVAELTARGIETWPELLAWLASAERPATPRKRRYPIAPANYRNLPDQPGVYRFLRSNGDVLYVGKATSLKKRVSSHFTKQSGATERALEMLTQVSEIAFTATSSPLEAALLETQTIKLINPPYNVQLLRGERGVWFATSDFHGAAPEPDEQHRFGPLSSRYSLRALGAFVRLLEGASASNALAAASVGAPTRFGPDEATFAGGFALFSAKHLAVSAATHSPRRRALDTAQRLLDLTPEEPEATDEDAPKVWDAPRVCRHLERAISQAYRVLRRSSWLCLLAESSVAYREPGAEVARYLQLSAAELSESGDVGVGTTLPAPTRPPRLALQTAFDAARYDSLRILTTELKRILKGGGEVKVRLSRSRLLQGAALERLLSVV
ncbi:MAG TPA: GIY-YIG nuclease family protein [Polyangiaceae bacterium]|nr:GIY-YIG nuclease family protein [Polyangiaceae bacterium]